jgi:VWFA-related protein
MGAGVGMKPGSAHRTNTYHHRRWVVALLLLVGAAGGIKAQQSSGGTGGENSASAPSPAKDSSSTTAATPTPSNETKPEVSSRDTGTTFRIRVNLVQVRVVVRDSKGNLIPDLKKEDFLLYDQGKLQTISTFDIETPKSLLERAAEASKTQQQDEGSPEEKVQLPQRFVALVFDDIHLSMSDAVQVRSSAKQLIDGLTPTDRLGIFGTSGQVGREFTSDKAALEQTLTQIISRPKMGNNLNIADCPDVNYYMADQAINKSNSQVFPIVTQETLQCMYQGNQQMLTAAQQQAQIALQRELTAGDTDSEFTYRALEDVIRRMTGLPGERILVLASPGFLVSTLTLDEMGIIDRANRANIVINTIDARGLYTPDVLGDISQPNADLAQTAGYKSQFRTAEQLENQFVLGDFAAGTGGTFFHNSNDLAGGLKRAGATPDVSYMLGFSPQNPKMDGRFHTIKVVMTNKQKYEVQARRGYYAPRKVEDPQEEAKQEIAEAVFSQEEIHELPVDLQTQYFKTGETEAHLSVVSRIDVKGVHFRKADGRNWDNLTVATVIFDENGNYVAGGEKMLEMRLLDSTYDRLSRTGLTMKSSFDLKPGKYLVRQVIRDSEGAQMAARNGAVVIPF